MRPGDRNPAPAKRPAGCRGAGQKRRPAGRDTHRPFPSPPNSPAGQGQAARGRGRVEMRPPPPRPKAAVATLGDLHVLGV